MANEFRHGSTVSEDTLYQSDWEKTTIHLFNSQATGDILYASSGTQLSRLAIGATAGMALTVSSGGIPQWGGDVYLGANKLKTTTMVFKEYDTSYLAILNLAENNFMGLRVGAVINYGAFDFRADMTAGADALGLSAGNTNDYYLLFKARDTDTGRVEVARLQGAADPNFRIGNNGNAIVGTYAGLVGFHATTPCNKADAYTQTYSTADRTIANATCTTMGDLVATDGGWGASSEANFDKITTAVDEIIADNLDLRQGLTALIDDLQEVGLVG